jgi:hypothetical protein
MEADYTSCLRCSTLPDNPSNFCHCDLSFQDIDFNVPTWDFLNNLDWIIQGPQYTHSDEPVVAGFPDNLNASFISLQVFAFVNLRCVVISAYF